MQNIHGNLFGVYNTKAINNNSPEFWHSVLRDYVEVSDYEQRIKFFQDHELNFQTEYSPDILLQYNSTDLNSILVFYEQELQKEGISAPYPTNLELLEWYLKQNLKQMEPNNLSTLENRNLVVFHNRFKMNVSPHSLRSFEKKLFNSYLEKYILKHYPEITVEGMQTAFFEKDVFDRKIQVEEKLNQIKERVKLLKEKAMQTAKPDALKSAEQLANLYDFYSANRDQYQVEATDFLDGYSKCKTEGISYIPSDKKISYDFIEGKNTAQFEMMLLKQVKEIEAPIELTDKMNKSENTTIIKIKWKGQKNQLYSVLRQLKNEHELISNSYNELADFIKLYVTGFESTSKETIEKELKKNNTLPKAKRVKIESAK